MTRRGLARLGRNGQGLARPGLAGHGSAWLGVARLGKARTAIIHESTRHGMELIKYRENERMGSNDHIEGSGMGSEQEEETSMTGKEFRFNAGYCTCKDEDGLCGWCLAQQGVEAVDNRDIGCRYQLFTQGQRHTTVDGACGRPIMTILSGIFESREDAEHGIGEFFSSVTTPADSNDKHYLDPDGVRIRVLRLRLSGLNGIPLYKLAQAYTGCQAGARRIEWENDHG